MTWVSLLLSSDALNNGYVEPFAKKVSIFISYAGELISLRCFCAIFFCFRCVWLFVALKLLLPNETSERRRITHRGHRSGNCQQFHTVQRVPALFWSASLLFYGRHLISFFARLISSCMFSNRFSRTESRCVLCAIYYQVSNFLLRLFLRFVKCSTYHSERIHFANDMKCQWNRMEWNVRLRNPIRLNMIYTETRTQFALVNDGFFLARCLKHWNEAVVKHVVSCATKQFH